MAKAGSFNVAYPRRLTPISVLQLSGSDWAHCRSSKPGVSPLCLGAASQLIFERLIKENTMAEPETKLAITEGELQKVVPFFRGLELAPWSITVTGPPIKEPSGSRLVH